MKHDKKDKQTRGQEKLIKFIKERPFFSHKRLLRMATMIKANFRLLLLLTKSKRSFYIQFFGKEIPFNYAQLLSVTMSPFSLINKNSFDGSLIFK